MAGSRARHSPSLRKGLRPGHRVVVMEDPHVAWQALAADLDVARREAAHAGDCSRGMGLSTTIFQIAIALGGITLIVKKRALWSASLLCGAAATAQMV